MAVRGLKGEASFETPGGTSREVIIPVNVSPREEAKEETEPSVTVPLPKVNLLEKGQRQKLTKVTNNWRNTQVEKAVPLLTHLVL